MTAVNTAQILADKGVAIAAPESVEVDGHVNPDRISSQGVTIHTGCKLLGKNTLICEGVELGLEGPVTLKNCYVGPNVRLKGGYFENAVFLEGAVAGSGSHVRSGTILEEQASIAHTVGLKQTILFPYVTLGSLINFCDCLMAGGTSRRNHSEVGSSYIHFNYTPNQDKATPSLIGDVPRGVMLNQSPIFLGGQGGMVGPCRIAYGTVIAAGSINRKDQLKEDHLIIESMPRSARIPFQSGKYQQLKRVLLNNIIYIGNLYALQQWYVRIRSQFAGPMFTQALFEGLVATLNTGIDERIKQLGRLKDNIEASLSGSDHKSLQMVFSRNGDDIMKGLMDLQSYAGDASLMDRFSAVIADQIASNDKNYMQCVKALTDDQAHVGSQWLQSIVDHVHGHIFAIFNDNKGI